MLSHIRDGLGFGRAAGKDRPLSTHIPYTRHVADAVIQLESGALLCVIKLDGLFFQTEDQAELNMRATVQNTMIRALGSSRFALWSTVVRRQVDSDLPGVFDDRFCDLLNRKYMAQLSQKRMFTNELYLTVLRSGVQGALAAGDKARRLAVRFGATDAANEQQRDAVEELEELTGTICRDLRKYGARPLTITWHGGALVSEPCAFFNSLLTGGIHRDMPLPRMRIASALGHARLHSSRRTMQVQGAVPADDRFGAMLSVKEYPPFTGPGLLDGLLQIDHEFILTQSFTLADKPIAQERMSRLKRQIAASDEAGSDVEEDIDFALNSLLNQEAVFGLHHLSLLCLSRELASLNSCIADLGACLTDVNVNWIREDLNLEAAFWAQLPGNHAYIARKCLLSSANFSGLSSMHNFAAGQREGLHWNTPITVLETTSQTPYCFNFHQRDIGHFLITGPTGSGKTVVLGFLLAQARRVQPVPRAVFFDKDRGAEILIRAMDGAYDVLTPGVASRFNPLQLDDTGANRAFLLRLLKAMLRPGAAAQIVDPEEDDILEQALVRLMREPAEHRSLANLAGLLAGRTRAGPQDLSARLRPWTEGEKAWLFNAKRDVLSFDAHRIYGFDMTSLLDNEELRTPALMYLFHRLDELLDGQPLMIFMDEGWRLLRDPSFSDFIVDKMKTIRKLNGIVGFGTQSAADIARAAISHTLIEQSATHIHFPNPRADEDSYVRRFGLTVKEFQFIRSTPAENRTFLIKHGNDSVIARLDLQAMPDIVKILSGRRETVEECARLRETLGDDPAAWLPPFCGWEAWP